MIPKPCYTKVEMLQQVKDSSFQTLKALVNKLDDLRNLSYDDLQTIRKGLKQCIKNIEDL